MNKINYSFVTPKIDSDHYVFGTATSLPKDIIQADGQYSDPLFIYEEQNKNGLETYNCTSFNTLKIIQAIAKKKYGLDLNLSDRDLGIRAGTRPPGNDPHTVAETLRNDGVCLEVTLPFTSDLANWQEYYSYKSADKAKCDTEADALVFKFEFGHEWVFTGGVSKEIRTSLMKEALKYSPLGISVSAWQDVNGVYVDMGIPNNHWTVASGWNESGWKCPDSYEPFNKTVSFDHDIKFCKRYRLVLKEVQPVNINSTSVEPKKKLWSWILTLLKSL